MKRYELADIARRLLMTAQANEWSGFCCGATTDSAIAPYRVRCCPVCRGVAPTEGRPSDLAQYFPEHRIGHVGGCRVRGDIFSLQYELEKLAPRPRPKTVSRKKRAPKTKDAEQS